jgi:hypothetical protein
MFQLDALRLMVGAACRGYGTGESADSRRWDLSAEYPTLQRGALDGRPAGLRRRRAQRTEWTLARHPPAYAGGYELARQSLP